MLFVISRSSSRAAGATVLPPAFGAEQREDALDALLEDDVDELLVDQGAVPLPIGPAPAVL